MSADKLVEKIKELAAAASTRRVRIGATGADMAVGIRLGVGAIADGALGLAARSRRLGRRG